MFSSMASLVSQVSSELLEELKIEKVLGGSVTKIEVRRAAVDSKAKLIKLKIPMVFPWKVELEIWKMASNFKGFQDIAKQCLFVSVTK